MDLVVGADGKLVLTKLQAACFHFALFVTVCYITYKTGQFSEGMWGLYAAVAVGHAVVDKTGAQVAAFKERKLDAESNSTLGAGAAQETTVVVVPTGQAAPPAR